MGWWWSDETTTTGKAGHGRLFWEKGVGFEGWRSLGRACGRMAASGGDEVECGGTVRRKEEDRETEVFVEESRAWAGVGTRG